MARKQGGDEREEYAGRNRTVVSESNDGVCKRHVACDLTILN